MSASAQSSFSSASTGAPPTGGNLPSALAEEGALESAFASFTEAAGSLERSYLQLQAEVAGLRHQLEDSNHDLTRSFEENHRMRQHLNHILEGLPCGVLVTEADGGVSIANPETRRLLGLLAGVSFESLDKVPLWMQELLDDLHGGAVDRQYRCRGGALEWISIHRAQLPAAKGASSIFILQDITESKRLQEAQDALRRRQALAEMSSLLAHEIRNPLGSLELFAELLVESEAGGERRQWALQLQAGLRTLAATVNNVLQFHSQPQPALAPTDLGMLLTSIAEFLRPLADQAEVRLELVHDLMGVWVAADRHRLEQVMLNLGLNAFRCMRGGGTLRISGSVVSRDCPGDDAGDDAGDRPGDDGGDRPGDDPSAAPGDGRQPAWVRVKIEDTGSGIAAEDLPLIFQPGFTTRPDSPGLGLAVCQTIMRQHGGEIAVASGSGSGTTFWLEFPRLGASQ